MDLKIHVAFGFHVNCYHSYRGDTPDEKGFGSDLRIIRKILAVLDELNAAGVPVKGTWDCENFFSLEKILPEYAPDILEGMRRRVRENGDEQIVMGYTNGALGAMEPEELAASVELALSNPAGSGLLDLFGTCEKIVRPQEVMFSPSQVRTYNALGVKALCLYYSCVPFDAFKTLVPPLPDEEAFNPLTFEYRGETLTVLPTYSNADVCDAGCLRAWVKDLRKKQLSGEIGRDCLLFINMDADAVFWESLDLPLLGNRLANTDGIRGLALEVADLPYVVFDTPGGYLKTHAPAGTLCFTQDTADGNFTGYASWAEKPYNRKIWTAVERSRLLSRVDPRRDCFSDRLQLLSTTHFGLATPVLNVEREKKADALAASLNALAADKEGPLTVLSPAGGTLCCLQLESAAFPLEVTGEGLRSFTAVPLGEKSVFLLLRFDNEEKERRIFAKPLSSALPEAGRDLSLQSGDTRLEFSARGVYRLSYRGRTVGGEELLSSYLVYGGKRFDFKVEEVRPVPVAGGRAVRVSGGADLPGEVSPGRFSYTFFTSDAAEGIFAVTDVSYPYTPERDAISTENSTLGRFTDRRWQEVCPFALRPALGRSLSVLKRNFEGDLSSFRVASFCEADPKNRTLDSFNNQLTAGLFGLTDGERGLAVGFARTVLSSMACCPMRLRPDGEVTMNPFGTFSGEQRHHPNRSGERIPKTYTLIAPQGKSLAPSYNGAAERAVLCLLPFEGDLANDPRLPDLLAFADGAAARGTDGVLSPFGGDNAETRPAAPQTHEKIRSPLLTGVKGNVGKYAVRGVRAVSYIARRQRAAKKP